MPYSAESGCASEWQAPRPFWNATAPIMAAFIMPPRASRSLPSRDRAREVRGDELDALERDRRRPSGDPSSCRYASRQCVSASKPVAAVTCGGMLSGELGIEDRDVRDQVRREEDRLLAGVAQRDDAERPTSLPVPAVVGSAIIGGTGARDRALAAGRVVVVDERRRVRGAAADELADVERRPPPTRDHESALRARDTPRRRRARSARSGCRATLVEHAGSMPALARASSATRAAMPGLHDARVGDDQRARRAERAAPRRGVCAAAPSPKTMRVGKFQTTRHTYRSLLHSDQPQMASK